MSYAFRTADTPEDFQQIRRLNHQIFSDELGQHAVRPDGLLPDAFETCSHYLIALYGDLVVGMVCVHDQPPWSVAKRLADPTILEALAPPLLEVRLLALVPAHRNRLALGGLLAGVCGHALEHVYRTLIISGVTAQIEMYQHLGFVQLGPPVTDGHAAFYPMALDMQALPARTLRSWQRYQRRIS